jgi:hypothetical protein
MPPKNKNIQSLLYSQVTNCLVERCMAHVPGFELLELLLPKKSVKGSVNVEERFVSYCCFGGEYFPPSSRST